MPRHLTRRRHSLGAQHWQFEWQQGLFIQFFFLAQATLQSLTIERSPTALQIFAWPSSISILRVLTSTAGYLLECTSSSPQSVAVPPSRVINPSGPCICLSNYSFFSRVSSTLANFQDQPPKGARNIRDTLGIRLERISLFQLALHIGRRAP
ncbi:hypothetical protein DFH06DRAFT_612247 [Mycena polygramma]|nr:hypothetical protein DFH06DRAFT_612247 [Mycena polygramma]